jgi:hypothetical protein
LLKSPLDTGIISAYDVGMNDGKIKKFREFIESASRVIDSWPRQKREWTLQHLSGSPTLDGARRFIDQHFGRHHDKNDPPTPSDQPRDIKAELLVTHDEIIATRAQLADIERRRDRLDHEMRSQCSHANLKTGCMVDICPDCGEISS